MATKPSEQQFVQLVKEQKSTIYTVCYMFSKDEDEVADLFEEVLVEPEHMHLGRPEEEETSEDHSADNGHQPL